MGHPLYADGTPLKVKIAFDDGQTHAYLLSEPTYVHFHTTPLPPPEPAKGKKGKKGKARASTRRSNLLPPPLWPSLTFSGLL